MEREYPHLTNWGDMDYELFKEIVPQIPAGIVVQLHNNGEPLLYPYLREALLDLQNNIRCFNTNGKLLLDRSDDIIDNLETLTISVVEGDKEQEEQYEILSKFIRRKRNRPPAVILRFLGRIDQGERWKALSQITATRILHAPEGSFAYQKQVTVPEIGICLDLLTHLAIDRFGNISLCVRFDPHGHLRIGHVNQGIEAAWNSEKRRFYIQKHIEQKRSELPGCNQCEYWGVPKGE